MLIIFFLEYFMEFMYTPRNMPPSYIKIKNTRKNISAIKSNKKKNTPRKNPSRKKYTFAKKKTLSYFVYVGGMTFFLAVISILLIILLSWLQSLDYFTLQNIKITGATRLPPHAILEIVNVYEGQNNLTVRVGEVYQKLIQNPWIKKATVKRVLPDSLFIDIEEVDTYFWREYNNTLYYADALGIPVAPVDETFFVSLPVLEVEKGAQDLVVHIPSILEELQKDIYPIEIKSLSWLRISAENKILFFMENLGVEVHIELHKWRENLKHLRLVLEDLIDKGELRNISKIKASDVVIVEK